ncbi:fibronectin type III domain-containing protein [Aeromicrobium choanae]|uniref:IPT/TIG domain-containing protein n=1 Tax=Aeromicrobium choanae TaxID=1736691 RepID=A0A1T4YQ27_9ACTN|nr:fibronectin type III domain-containing protein [Aeromicrobium choanae]SKB03882.1 IPT/TIG domain-containing protein [Aeromicrobium choanae]
MTTTQRRLPRPLHLLLAFLLGTTILLSGQGLFVPASAASITWVDGGDDQPCLNDDNGRALDALPSDQWCTPINGCYQDDDGKYVLPSRKTGIWQGNPKDVKYADEIKAEPAPKPTAKPTTKPTTKPATKPTAKPTTKPTDKTTGTGAPAAGADELGVDENEVVAEGAPSAPAAPVLKVDGKDVTVTWQPSPDAELESVTGYVLRFSGADPVQLDATTTTHTFTDQPDGTYRAAVRAVNETGESPSSPPSEIATVGAPVTEVVGTVAVTGDLEPGAAVTITGTGFATDVPELTIELHSTPVVLGTVATDAKGSFTTAVTIPETVEAGDHSLVVLFEGTEITSTPVEVGGGEIVAAAAVDEVVETVPPHTGLALLVALALAGGLSLFWHVLTGRRRAARSRLAGVVA